MDVQNEAAYSLITDELFEEVMGVMKSETMYQSLVSKIFVHFTFAEVRGNKEAAKLLYEAVQDFLEMNKRVKERLQNDGRL